MSTKQTTRPTVLVVDDDLSLRVLTSIVLARVGYSPTAVSGVVRALERVAEGGVDVVLSDLGMPGLDGFDLLTALRACRMSPPVVAMTASDDEERIMRALGLGARTVVRKPFTGEELDVALQVALGAVRTAASDRVERPAAGSAAPPTSACRPPRRGAPSTPAAGSEAAPRAPEPARRAGRARPVPAHP